MLEIIVLSLTAVLNLLLGLVVYLKNPRAATNRFFFMLTGSFVVWSVVNYISVHPVILDQLIWIRLVLFCGALLNVSLFLTFLAFPLPEIRPGLRHRVRLIIYATVFVMFLTLTPFVFNRLNVSHGKAEPVPGPGIVLFMLHTLGLIGGSILILAKKYRTSRIRVRNQLKLVLLGIGGTFTLIVVTNFFLVVAFNFTALIPFGPAFTLIFSGSFAYAIVKHRLFDIRAAVARALAYVLSLGSLVGIYGIGVFGIAENLLNSQDLSNQRVFYIVCAVLTGLLFQPLKAFFDKITNQIFFRDAYDPQELIDSLNKILVSSVELEPLLNQTAQVLEANLKAQFCAFSINRTSYSGGRSIGNQTVKLKDTDLAAIHRTVPLMKQRLVVGDELAENDHNRELHKALRDNDIAVLIRLTTTIKHDAEGMGYLLLGPKKSGNPYSNQDIDIIQIIANELIIAIENALRFEEIEKFNITLQEKVDNATRQLRQTNEKLKALDESKDEFISMASHQLRTPLTSVKGYLSMVIDGDAGKLNKMQVQLLDQAFASSQRMVYLIADLLNVSRLKTGKFVIETVPTNLADVVEGELQQLTETAKARNLDLSYDKPKDFPLLLLDETKIRQVIMNFADNAIYYTPSGGHIKVELEDRENTIEFRVVDDGLGVPKHEQHHLFGKFYRAGNARKARPDGTGLGLFMAKKVVVAQGGSIIFKSEEGKGSTFGFTFAKDKLLPNGKVDRP